MARHLLRDYFTQLVSTPTSTFIGSYLATIFMRRILGYSYVGDTNYNINSVGTFLISTADTTPTVSPSFAVNTKAGINSGLNQEFWVKIPNAAGGGRDVISADIGKILVLKSTTNPTYNSGCFLITGIDSGTNSYVVNFRSGTYMAGTTTVAAGSNGVSLPTGTINVASTTGFPASGSIIIVSTTGQQTVNYTSTNATQFLGCTLGTGTINAGNTVSASVFITLPTATITVSSTTGFPSSGRFFTYSSTGRQTITYTGVTATTFTGCTGGGGTVTGGAFIVSEIETTIAAASNGASLPQATINVASTAFPSTAITTITSTSNGVGLPAATINVVSTATFPTAGTIYIKTLFGPQLVTYTGTTATTFTGCTGGMGYLAGTTIAIGSNGATLPQATINVASVASFPQSGTVNVTTSAGLQVVTYTGVNTTLNQFTGCTGGTGTMSTGGVVGENVYAGFGPNGIVYVTTAAGVQQVNYTDITATSFTGCTGGTGLMSTGNTVYYSPSVPRIEPFDSMNWYLYEKDSVVSNLAQGASNGNTSVQYRGNGTSTTPRIILQSPNALGWQVRVCHETTNDTGVGSGGISAECALITFAPGFGGNASGDFAVSGPHLHTPLFYNSNSNNYQGGAVGFGDNLNIPGGTTAMPYRITMVGDTDGYGISIFGRRPGNATSPRSYFLTFGMCETEVLPLPPNNEARLYAIGSGNSQSSGNNLNDVSWYPGTIASSSNAQGLSVISSIGRFAVPITATVSLLAYTTGNGTQGSPIFDGSAGDTPWFGGVELFAIDIIAGTTFNTWNNSSVANYGFASLDSRFLGTIPHIREGRANFAEYSTTADLVGQHTRRGMWLLWGGPPVIT